MGIQLLAVVRERLRDNLNGHPDRAVYEALIGKTVEVLPNSERFVRRSKGRNGGRTFYSIRPVGDKTGRELQLAKPFLQFIRPEKEKKEVRRVAPHNGRRPAAFRR
ncbi:MAG: hypothetical protein HYT40_01985 [Candidatus Sungbacteria bacterium]|uniref:Uncharacterized protein n=1 Tax=Candidatus Sungiibacteriota bacterium TaxID=2750080 RepID=A0A931SBK6_9BACT|nr:hypothetical protein [Candidatus Sungbacteria bacterium]